MAVQQVLIAPPPRVVRLQGRTIGSRTIGHWRTKEIVRAMPPVVYVASVSDAVTCQNVVMLLLFVVQMAELS